MGEEKRPSVRQRPSFTKTPNFLCVGCHNSKGGADKGYIQLGKAMYHMECLICPPCQKLIDPTESNFSYVVDKDTGIPQPVHEHCYGAMLGLTCVVCTTAIKRNDKTRQLEFMTTPFFEDEKVCFKCFYNKRKPLPQCTSCKRYEPKKSPFNVLTDQRHICNACARTVCMSKKDIGPLWEQEILPFFQNVLGLRVWDDMQDIPITCVKQDTLYKQMGKSPMHSPQDKGMARGLTRSESEIDSDDVALQQQQQPRRRRSKASTTVVWDILCLIGLPKELTASVLAHEATHAWIKLHPKYNATAGLPPYVEEGLCQLVAYLFLTQGLPALPKSKNSKTNNKKKLKEPTDQELREYFKHSIQQNEDPVYGDGFRIAYQIYEIVGIKQLLEWVVHKGKFPSKQEIQF